jgi:hypothetical protein
MNSARLGFKGQTIVYPKTRTAFLTVERTGEFKGVIVGIRAVPKPHEKLTGQEAFRLGQGGHLIQTGCHLWINLGHDWEFSEKICDFGVLEIGIDGDKLWIDC